MYRYKGYILWLWGGGGKWRDEEKSRDKGVPLLTSYKMVKRLLDGKKLISKGGAGGWLICTIYTPLNIYVYME